ncbi:MAG: outer membrane lipid asymmetry maintenance protein MlaD [Sphingomonadales bacterium]|nr:outer membrane lipid asymmetry maintenance protein MlaD [Sphingomonadales bacterium]
MSKNYVESIVGLVVLVAAAGFFTFTYSKVEVGTVRGYELNASFDRIDGLLVGSDVRLSGIKVGTVLAQEINFDTYQAVVRFSVDSAVELPVDSSASITSEGLLGGHYLSLGPGGLDEYLEDGDEVEFTEGSVDLFGLIGQAIYSTDDDSSDEQ